MPHRVVPQPLATGGNGKVDLGERKGETCDAASIAAAARDASAPASGEV